MGPQETMRVAEALYAVAIMFLLEW
jgi:hypothetical protein